MIGEWHNLCETIEFERICSSVTFALRARNSIALSVELCKGPQQIIIITASVPQAKVNLSPAPIGQYGDCETWQELSLFRK